MPEKTVPDSFCPLQSATCPANTPPTPPPVTIPATGPVGVVVANGMVVNATSMIADCPSYALSAINAAIAAGYKCGEVCIVWSIDDGKLPVPDFGGRGGGGGVRPTTGLNGGGGGTRVP